ncbi:retrovirus-related pol polyprotein from transposon TNT 1-94 [Tanacetum coccineum]
MTEFPQLDSGLSIHMFTQGDDPIACLNKAMDFLTVATIQDGRDTMQQVQGRQGQSYTGTGYKGEGRMARQCTQPKRPRNTAWFKDNAMLAEAQESGQFFDEEQLAFLDLGIPNGQVAQTTILNNDAFQTKDLNAYDSDCDDVSNAQAVLMANLSNYGSDIISELSYKLKTLKEHIKSMQENDKEEKVKQDMDEIETINIELEHSKNVLDNGTIITNATTIAPRMFKLDFDPLAPRLLKNRDAHIDYLKYTQEQANVLWRIVEQAKAKQPLDNALDFACKHAKRIQELLVYVQDTCPNANKPSEKLVVQIVLWTMTQLVSVRQFCDSDLEVSFRKHTCFIRNLDGVNLLSGSRDTNLYTISLDDILKTSSICLLSKASKTKSWLWHRRLSYLNFDTLHKLAKDGLARGIPKLKFKKDHFCSACALGKSKKSSHQPKVEDTNQEKLYFQHMDVCGPMRVESINGKKYILVIVDDYS